MTHGTVTIHVFEIVADGNERAAYRKTRKLQAPEDGLDRALDEAVADFEASMTDGTVPPGTARPERNLDIEEQGADGLYVYAFQINRVLRGKQVAEFADPPVAMLDIGFPDAGKLFTAWRHRHNRRWAFLKVDLAEVRSSPVNARIPGGHGLRLPFQFNMIDTRYGISPLAFGDHPHKDGLAGGEARPDFTHGGIHPPAGSHYDVPRRP